MKQLFYLIFIIPLFSTAQKPCATIMSKEQMDKLYTFQQTLDKSPYLFLNKTTKYVPIKVHIVGNDKGVGYYKPDLLIASFCKINKDFSPIGVQFYIKDEINYINNTQLSQTKDDEIYSVTDNYKDPSSVNVFFAGSSDTYCGVYYPGLDAVYIINGCQGINATTLTHELGHFFSLPHTFYEWENNTTPPLSSQEKIDGSNCRNVGDRFCDTKPDYISSRWDCNTIHNRIDPNGVSFSVDSSIYMNYALDACHSRFSNEQLAAMDNNLTSRGIINQNMLMTNPAVPSLIYPIENDSNQNAASVRLIWNKSEGASLYQLQVARLKLWETAYLNILVKDTFYDAKLFGNWQFNWRVKAISLSNMCGDYSDSKSFFAKIFPIGLTELSLDQNSIKIYPNPSYGNESIHILSNTTCQMTVVDITGKEVYKTEIVKGSVFDFLPSQTGLYLFQFMLDGKNMCKKIMIQ